MGRKLWGDKPRINFILKKPDDTRRTFQVLKRVVKRGQPPKHSKVEDARIDGINRAWLEGRQDATASETQVREVMAELQSGAKRKTMGVSVHNEENRKALSQYWERHFSHRVYDVESSALSIRHRLERAVEALGPLSLYSEPKARLQGALDAKYKDHRQRALAASLNGLLKFLGRDFELTLRPKRRRQPRHVKLQEFDKAQALVSDPLDRLLQRAAIATGLRQGELFALNSDSIQGRHFFSEKQMDRELTRRWTKTRDETRRRIYVLPGFQKDVRAWCELPLAKKKAMRARAHAAIIRKACQDAFPEDPEKHCRFHDLRHSFAIHLVSRGVTIGQVAKCLNESELVCEEYYGGFYLQDEALDAIERIMRPGGGMVDTHDLKS